jgi:hypothetical protein
MRHLGAIAVALAAYAVCFPILHAAEIRIDPKRETVAVFEGKIEVGDFDKVRDFVFAQFPRPYMSDTDLRGMGADAAMSAVTKTKSIVASYLYEMGVVLSQS